MTIHCELPAKMHAIAATVVEWAQVPGLLPHLSRHPANSACVWGERRQAIRPAKFSWRCAREDPGRRVLLTPFRALVDLMKSSTNESGWHDEGRVPVTFLIVP
jgi:hypothetical protein